jgi:hypothetical protein
MSIAALRTLKAIGIIEGLSASYRREELECENLADDLFISLRKDTPAIASFG